MFKMKLKYIGESFGIDELTSGKIYEAKEENGMYRVIDDSGEDYLYSKENPAPLDGSSIGGKWEIMENDIKGNFVMSIYRKTSRKNKNTDINVAIAGK